MVASLDHETLLEQLEAEFLSSDVSSWQFDSNTPLADLQLLALGDEPEAVVHEPKDDAPPVLLSLMVLSRRSEGDAAARPGSARARHECARASGPR